MEDALQKEIERDGRKAEDVTILTLDNKINTPSLKVSHRSIFKTFSQMSWINDYVSVFLYVFPQKQKSWLRLLPGSKC